jgi:hypothetical protein
LCHTVDPFADCVVVRVVVGVVVVVVVVVVVRVAVLIVFDTQQFMDTYASYAGTCIRSLVFLESIMRPREGVPDHPFRAYALEVRVDHIVLLLLLWWW